MSEPSEGSAAPGDAKPPSRRGRVVAAAEVVAAAGLLALILANEGLRLLLFEVLRVIGAAVVSAPLLVAADPPAWIPASLCAVKAALLLAPAIRALRLSPRRRLAWVPAGFLIWVLVLGTSLPGVTGPVMWLLLIGASGAAWAAVKRPWLRGVSLLPWLVVMEPLLGHSPLSGAVWSTERLAEKCASNDGVRPVDLRPEHAVPRHFSVTPVSPELFLLAGERGSYWVRRDAGGARLGPGFRLRGNLWQGCVRGGKVWMAAKGRVCEAAIPTSLDEEPRSTCHDAPGPPGVGLELDYVDVLCPAGGSSVLVTQLVRGGMLEVEPATGASRWHPVMPGLNLQGVMRKDGRIVGITMSRLFVFDPQDDRVLEDQRAGLVAMGIDICAADDAVVVADFTGRVRLFEREDDGPYRLRGGVNVPAARRVAFSPDCARIVVTSGDDRHAHLIRRTDLAVLRAWNLGPGLRDVAFLDDRWAAAADACTVNLLDTTAEP